MDSSQETVETILYPIKITLSVEFLFGRGSLFQWMLLITIVNAQKYIFDDSDSNIEIELNFAFDNYSALF